MPNTGLMFLEGTLGLVAMALLMAFAMTADLRGPNLGRIRTRSGSRRRSDV